MHCNLVSIGHWLRTATYFLCFVNQKLLYLLIQVCSCYVDIMILFSEIHKVDTDSGHVGMTKENVKMSLQNSSHKY